MYTAPIMADKDILEFVQSSINIIHADSGDENEMNNAAPVPTSSEMRNVMESGQSDTKPLGKSSHESLVLIYRPTDGMKGRVDLAQSGV
ncbi:hypothetical protein TNCV_1900461 [Trichonephila clavipes]|nr:hypothetical protein TNCV_1900461 [Trichonephila clavipes]